MRKCVILAICLFSFDCFAVQLVKGGSKTYNVVCTTPKNKFVRMARHDIGIFLRSYKPKTLKKHLKQIRMCGKLSLNDQDWAMGTYDVEKKIIYMQVYGRNDIEYLLHHELSSIILKMDKNHWQIREKFRNLSKKSYKPAHLWGKVDWMAIKHKYLKDGFIVPYAQTGAENDFNMIVAFYKTSYLKHRMRRAAKYPLIAKKYNIVKKMYRGL
tara:strand:+ start:1750 stop:2385 length:636 start_codon:yes stop_codon:yes gene_type:complete